MNKPKYLIIGFMTVICLLANLLNQDMEFTIFSIIGYVVMLSLSFVKYEWIEKYYIWIIVVFIAILVIINITPLGYTVNGMKCMKIDKYLISNSVLLLIFLPLAAITMNKNKVGGNTCYEIDTIRADKTEIEPGGITATGNAE